jgi:hypothetical protein
VTGQWGTVVGPGPAVAFQRGRCSSGSSALRNDQFAEFITWRRDQLVTLISSATAQ